jgi:hypothetical protein
MAPCFVHAATNEQEEVGAPTEPQPEIPTVVPSQDGLPMHFTDHPFDDVLDELSRQSGVRFHLTPSLRTRSIYATFSGNNWSDAIKTFLRDYNHLAIVDRDGALRRVWITGFSEASVVSPSVSLTKGYNDPEQPFMRRPGQPDGMELPLALWQSAPYWVAPRADLPAEPIEVDPLIFDNLKVGQPVELPIPQESAPLFGVVSETHDELGGEVRVWSGPVDGSHDSASFTISHGSKATYITVATGSRIYELSVDNVTGGGSVVDEADMTSGKDHDDIILPPLATRDEHGAQPSSQ